MRILDLYCGGGLAAWGYWRSGRFHEIVGVDTNPHLKRVYAFDFICADVLSLTCDFLVQFDFIHASPPCQPYSKLTRDFTSHRRLIRNTHRMLYAAGLPYVIENVEGSSRELRPNIVMDGNFFGLPIQRRRYFFSSLLEPGRFLRNSPGSNMRHVAAPNVRTGSASNIRSSHVSHMRIDRLSNLHIHESLKRTDVCHAMGLDFLIPARVLSRISKEIILQGIPPVMTKFLAESMFSQKAMIG